MEFREELETLQGQEFILQHEITELEEKADALSAALQKLEQIRTTLAASTHPLTREERIVRDVEAPTLNEGGRPGRGEREKQVLAAASILTDKGAISFKARDLRNALLKSDPNFPPATLYNYLQKEHFRRASHGTYFLVV